MSAQSGALRRRRKRSLATRLRIGWIFIVVGVAALGYGVYTFITLPSLRVHTVDIQVAGSAVTERDVRRAAAIDLRSNMWLLDTDRIARRIEALPYVDVAVIGRVPPAGLTIAVTQREPAACVHTGPTVVTVDDRRRILQAGCARPRGLQIGLAAAAAGTAAGTTLSAATLAALLADARTLRDAGVAVHFVRQDRFGELIAVDVSGVELRLVGDADLGAEARLVGPILTAARSGRPIRAVDLRAAGTPIVEYR